MKKAAELSLVGGDPALDFANTAGWHAGDEPTERLTEYGELLGWARHAELLSERERQALAAVAEEHPRKAAQALKHAVEVRELVYRIFTALAQGGAPAAGDLERIQPRASPCALSRPGGVARLGAAAAVGRCGRSAAAGISGGGVGGAAPGEPAAGPAPAVRESSVRVALRRSEQKRHPPLVLRGRLRQ